GAWPTPAAAGSGRRPGGWPTAAPAGGGAAPAGPSGSAPGQGAPPPSAAHGRPTPPPVDRSAPAPAAYNPAPGGLDPRMLWPNILEAVKNRRRFTWILLSQNAHVAGFDGTTLQIGFVNAGARDNFASSGSEDVLRAALGEQFNVHWKIEALVDTSGGGSAPAGGHAPPAPGGYGGGAGGGYGGSPAPASRPAPPQASPSAPHPSTPAPPPQQPGPAAPTAAPAPPPAPEPPPVSPEDDTPEDDDPDLDESALSGHELIVRELGATVVEEIANE
ncbi:DNA polymerase III subunit gamma and tau, partial [Streptomyces heilongjiangensis]